jgi:hypothetical protein
LLGTLSLEKRRQHLIRRGKTLSGWRFELKGNIFPNVNFFGAKMEGEFDEPGNEKTSSSNRNI